MRVQTLLKKKTGVWTGSYAINPVNGREMPIWIADYVLVSYGTGAIMAVPAHDTRDWEFAKQFNLDIIPVLEGGNVEEEAYTEDGIHINSGFLDGLDKAQAIDKMVEWLEAEGVGNKKSLTVYATGSFHANATGVNQFQSFTGKMAQPLPFQKTNFLWSCQ